MITCHPFGGEGGEGYLCMYPDLTIILFCSSPSLSIPHIHTVVISVVTIVLCVAYWHVD